QETQLEAQIARSQLRIEELQAQSKSSEAIVKSLEQSSKNLEIEFEKEQGKVAMLQRRAADAKRAQQEVEIELAKQQERAAKAETLLASIRNPRQVPHNLLPALKAAPGGKAVLFYQIGSQETFGFAYQLWLTLLEANWQVPFPQPLQSTEQ